MSKKVRLSEETDERLAAHKGGSETFSDVVLRLAGDRSLLELAGLLTDEQVDGLEAAIEEHRARRRAALEDLVGELPQGEHSCSIRPSSSAPPRGRERVARARRIEEDLLQQRVSTMTLFDLFYGVGRVEPTRCRAVAERNGARDQGGPPG